MLKASRFLIVFAAALSCDQDQVVAPIPNRLCTLTSFDIPNDGKANVTYDDIGISKLTIQSNEYDGLLLNVQFERDHEGRITKASMFPWYSYTTITYDDNGRPELATTFRFAEETGAPYATGHERFEFDSKGRIVKKVALDRYQSESSYERVVYDDKDNIVEKYDWVDYPPGEEEELDEEYLDWDDKINPFLTFPYRLAAMFLETRVIQNATFRFEPFQSKNNPTHYRFDLGGEALHDVVVTYEYNQWGYPVKSTTTISGLPPTVSEFAYECE